MSNTDAKIENPQTLEQWTGVLCDQEMPIFSNTAQNIYRSLDDKHKGAMELASIILQDPNLTAKILKVSNSVHYNPSRQKMNTISRAIVILGSNVVRELTVACSFFESIISPENKHRANKEIAHAIHAAVQAKEIAIACNDPSPEEVFIAALLNNIGSIAFWCFGGKQCQYIAELLQSGSFSTEQAENKVLGFTLKELAISLSKSWNLGGLIEESIANPSSSQLRPQIVHLAKEITLAVDDGWESEAMAACLGKLEKLAGQGISISKASLKKNTLSAVKIACKFGAHDASQFIQADHSSKIDEISDHETIDKNKIQFHILQDITQHISGPINLNLLFEMVVEGIHRGLGMDRTLFCILSSDKKNLNEKLAVGWLKAINEQKIKFDVSSQPINIFFKAIHSAPGIWAHPKTDSVLFTPSVTNYIGRSECFLIPVCADNKAIGLIYTDRSIHNKPLTEEDFNAAKHFSQQANIGLALYKINK
jgi:HD-like signal output (HDOD) protein